MNIETDRILLRPWAERDRQPFAEMSADPAVMEHLIPLNSGEAAHAQRDEPSDAWIDLRRAHLAEHGFTFWALEAKANESFVRSNVSNSEEEALIICVFDAEHTDVRHRDMSCR